MPAITLGEGNTAESAEACMTASYAEGVNDEFCCTYSNS